MKISLNWCTTLLLYLSQATDAFSTSLGTVHLVFDAKLSIVSTPPHATSSTSQPLFDIATPFTLAQYELALPIMPLHLLGKKSWNVYNKSNIDKVRHDEAIAKAREEAEEERMQEIDAARRLAILRGEEPEAPLPLPPPDSTSGERRSADDAAGRGDKREKRKRKRVGEDDTDFELRIARENDRTKFTTEEDDNTTSIPSERRLVLRKETTRNAPVVDSQGHIDLFPQDLPPITHNKSAAEKRDDHADKVKARKEKQIEDQLSLKFDNAAGYGTSLASKAWYETTMTNTSKEGEEGGEDDEVDMIGVGKDVWGNVDPRRRDREKARITNSDPLAIMKAGSKKVREVETERRKWREEREKEMLDLRDRELEEEERRKRRKRKYGDEGEMMVEGLILGWGGDRDRGEDSKRRRGEEDERREHRRREGHRSRGERDRDRSREDRRSNRDRETKDRDHRRDRDVDRSHRRGHDEDRRHRSHHRH